MTKLLERLRSETRAQHEAMEALFTLPRSRAEHTRWLERFYGFLEPLEARIAAVLDGEHPVWRGRRKSIWLRQDLTVLGVDVEKLPRASDLPDLSDDARCFGALYVFEGASLGGQLIARHLETAVGLADGVGYRYYLGYGPETGRRWQEFRTLLLTHSSPQSEDRTIAAAAETFSTLRTWCASQP